MKTYGIITDYLISEYGFSPVNHLSSSEAGVDQFTCMLRIHVMHFLFYSENLKHFSLAVKYDTPKGSPGTKERKIFNQIMLPRVIQSTENADELMNFLLLEELDKTTLNK